MSGQVAVPFARLASFPHVREVHADPSAVYSGVTCDTRSLKPGDLFVAVPGVHDDGSRYISDAVARGASGVLSTQPLSASITHAVSDHPRRSMAFAAEDFYGYPTRALEVVGVTGTNGKTTIAFLLRELLATLGFGAVYVGTLGTIDASGASTGTHTTPESYVFSSIAARARETGARYLVTEASSHALAQHRLDAVRFKVAVFTNLTQDHLDYHVTMANYAAAKRRLFVELAPEVAVVNLDDAFGKQLRSELECRVVSYSLDAQSDADVRVMRAEHMPDGALVDIASPSGDLRIRWPMLGAHNLANLAAVVSTANALGLDLRGKVSALEHLPQVPGRVEFIGRNQGVDVWVDYAHTPDALERLLAAARGAGVERVVVVFGCGGDRDRGKRPLMGEIAARGADVMFVTSDNPRSEQPEAIANDIVRGLTSAGAEMTTLDAYAAGERGYLVDLDRRSAITAAVARARSGDRVLIAGKGHERFQTIGATSVPFSDQHVARQALDLRRKERA